MSKVVLRITILLVSLPSLVLAAAPAQWLRLNTRVSEGSLGEAVGDYSLDGEAHGYPKYKQEGKGSRLERTQGYSDPTGLVIINAGEMHATLHAWYIFENNIISGSTP
jgi:hypothetical protein